MKVVCHDRFVLDNPRIAYISSTDTKEIGRMRAMFLLNHFHSSGAAAVAALDAHLLPVFPGAADAIGLGVLQLPVLGGGCE